MLNQGFSSVQLLSCVRLFATPWTAARQASLSLTNSRSLPKLMSIELVMPSNHLILCRPLLLPSIFPSIKVFSNESALYIRWPKYWSNQGLLSLLNIFLGVDLGILLFLRDNLLVMPFPSEEAFYNQVNNNLSHLAQCMLGSLSHEPSQCLLSGLRDKMTGIETMYGLKPLNMVYLTECLIQQQEWPTVSLWNGMLPF